MNNPRFIDQYNKIVGAYLRDELRPMDCCACFVGNLMNGAVQWRINSFTEKTVTACLNKEANGFYSLDEVRQLERVFMGWSSVRDKDYWTNEIGGLKETYPDYEDRLYRAMERALLYLRQLHESKGEVIEGYEFRKRELAKIKT